jgi:hypothetical protein
MSRDPVATPAGVAKAEEGAKEEGIVFTREEVPPLLPPKTSLLDKMLRNVSGISAGGAGVVAEEGRNWRRASDKKPGSDRGGK